MRPASGVPPWTMSWDMAEPGLDMRRIVPARGEPRMKDVKGA